MARRRSTSSGFEQRFRASLRSIGIVEGDRLTVGFSGGYDSLALSIALARVKDLVMFDVLLVHVEHGLRDRSTADGCGAKLLANSLGLPFQSVALLPGLRDRATNMGIEEAARRERYEALAAAARDWGSQTIVLAHQANDQAETLLLHLFRGTGLDGLAGMAAGDTRSIPWWPSSSSPTSTFRLVRPLLNENRSEIERYVLLAGFAPIEDDSNASRDFARNAIRLDLMPAILELWPAVIESISRLGELVRPDAQLLDQMAASQYRVARNNDRTLCTDTVARLPVPMARRVILRWLIDIGVMEPSLDVVERCYDLVLTKNESRLIEVGSGVSVVRASQNLTTFSNLLDISSRSTPLVGTGSTTTWEVSIGSGYDVPETTMRVPFEMNLEVRELRRGDRWWNTTRSVFEDLRAAGIHPLLRTQLLVVAADTGVLLIPAIYPTIRTSPFSGRSREVEIRWRKAEKLSAESARTKGFSES